MCSAKSGKNGIQSSSKSLLTAKLAGRCIFHGVVFKAVEVVLAEYVLVGAIVVIIAVENVINSHISPDAEIWLCTSGLGTQLARLRMTVQQHGQLIKPLSVLTQLR